MWQTIHRRVLSLLGPLFAPAKKFIFEFMLTHGLQMFGSRFSKQGLRPETVPLNAILQEVGRRIGGSGLCALEAGMLQAADTLLLPYEEK